MVYQLTDLGNMFEEIHANPGYFFTQNNFTQKEHETIEAVQTTQNNDNKQVSWGAASSGPHLIFWGSVTSFV